MTTLDPLSALSVASAVVTFVDFVAELVQEADTISSKGSSARVAQHKIVTADLISINQSLQARVPPRVATEHSVNAEEQVRLVSVVTRALVTIAAVPVMFTVHNIFTAAWSASFVLDANKIAAGSRQHCNTV